MPVILAPLVKANDSDQSLNISHMADSIRRPERDTERRLAPAMSSRARS
jgi:hypothetical protein